LTSYNFFDGLLDFLFLGDSTGKEYI